MVNDHRPRSPRIALILDHPQRDLAGLVLLAHELCQRGAVCHIVPMNIQEPEIWALEPDFVLLNFVRRGNDGFAGRLARAGIAFGVLDTEGGVWDTPASYSSMLWSDRTLLRQVREACMWGPRLAEHVVDEEYFTADQVVVTGCPRFDFYAPSWRTVVDDEANDALGYVLINTNFSFANPRFVSVERNVLQLRDEIGWSHERTMEQEATERAGMAEIIRITQLLSADLPQARIVLRPHPFEATEPYGTALASCSNVSINGDGLVQPRIFRAAAVIQRGCSTAIEAAMASVPTLSPQWFSIAGLPGMTEQVSDLCATYPELRDKVAAILGGRYTPPAGLPESIDRVVTDWFCAADGCAHHRVADAVMARLPADRQVDAALCHRYLHGLGERGFTWSAQGAASRLRHALDLPPTWSFRRARAMPQASFEQSDKRFHATQVEGIVQRVQEAARRGGRRPRPVTAAPASTRGEMKHAYDGFAVTVACA